jgi:hypothetical protein
LFFGGASVGDRVNYPCPLSAVSPEDGNLREFDLCGDNDDDDNIDKRIQEQESQVIKITQILVHRYCQCCKSALIFVGWIRIRIQKYEGIIVSKNKKNVKI